MKNTERYNRAFNYFKQNYCYKMGGTQTILLPNGLQKTFDDREYYSGRGSKYNTSIKHDIKGVIKVTRKAYSSLLKKLKEQEKEMVLREKQETEMFYKAIEAKNKGLYAIDKGYVLLSQEEQQNRVFDELRLANTLQITLEDVMLLNSTGKTYVFAKSKDGKLYEMFHPDLDSNNLSIHISEASEERIKSFNSSEWQNAPYAEEVGQTRNANHFVC